MKVDNLLVQTQNEESNFRWDEPVKTDTLYVYYNTQAIFLPLQVENANVAKFTYHSVKQNVTVTVRWKLA